MKKYKITLTIARLHPKQRIEKEYEIISEDEDSASGAAKLIWANEYINRDTHLCDFKYLHLAKNFLKGIKFEKVKVELI